MCRRALAILPFVFAATLATAQPTPDPQAQLKQTTVWAGNLLIKAYGLDTDPVRKAHIRNAIVEMKAVVESLYPDARIAVPGE